MEIVQELPLVDYILVPIGGGGLATGVSTLAKLLNPHIKVIGVEPAGAACMKASLEAGHVVKLPHVSTIADGTAVQEPGDKIFPYLQQNLDGIITVEDEELIVAFLDMVENHKMIVENSGLLTVAALRHLDFTGKKVVSILSGGNMDVITMSSVVQRGVRHRAQAANRRGARGKGLPPAPYPGAPVNAGQAGFAPRSQNTRHHPTTGANLSPVRPCLLLEGQ